MSTKKSVLKVLVVGENDELKTWIGKFVSERGCRWSVRYTDCLRVACPENQLERQDIIIVLWTHPEVVTIDEVLQRESVESRSVEGALGDLRSFSGKNLLSRTVVLGPGMTREDAIYLSEYELGGVFSLPDSRKSWDRQIETIVTRTENLHTREIERRTSAEERYVSRFQELLSVWGRLSDEVKMNATDQLLRVLGDTSRYCELLAAKSLAEGSFSAAEQWLRKAISKNPNYFSAMRMLADVYLRANKPNKALEILDKMKESNPRNVDLLVKIAHCHMQLGDLQKAERSYSKALCIDEHHQQARENYGRLKILLGDYEAARSLLKNTNQSRELAGFLNKVGIELVAQEKFEQSIQHYKNAQKVIPGNEQSHLLFLNIGLAYAKWGKYKEARQYASLALIRRPEYQKATQLLKKIEERLAA